MKRSKASLYQKARQGLHQLVRWRKLGRVVQANEYPVQIRPSSHGNIYLKPLLKLCVVGTGCTMHTVDGGQVESSGRGTLINKQTKANMEGEKVIGGRDMRVNTCVPHPPKAPHPPKPPHPPSSVMNLK